IPAGPGVAVLSTTGGGAVIAADKAEAHGVLLPQFTAETEAYLATVIPEYGSSRNPSDLTAQALNDPDGLRQCGEAVSAEPALGPALPPHPTPHHRPQARL